jgi:NAD(P)-dependent dehydrogenase (short-subunit alcohol dehydrogenase family)
MAVRSRDRVAVSAASGATVVSASPFGGGAHRHQQHFCCVPRVTMIYDRYTDSDDEDYHMRLQGKTAVITGAGSGLGRESALLFAREGANVVVSDLIEKRALKVADEVNAQGAGGKAVGLKADVRVEAEMDAAVALAVSQFGRIDIMFANAGVAPEGFGSVPFEEFTVEQWNGVNDVNLVGVFLASKAAVKEMKKQGDGGTIVVTGSAGGIMAYPGFFAYCAGKAGAHHLVKAMAFDLGRFGIRANAIAPTHGMSVNLAMPPDADVLGLSYEEAAVAESGAWNPAASPIPLKLNRPPRLIDNAYAALFLASDESAYMSGVVLPATDGGTLSRVAMYFEANWEETLAPDEESSPA